MAKFTFGNNNKLDVMDIYQIGVWTFAFIVMSAIGSAISDFRLIADLYTGLATSALVFVLFGLVISTQLVTKKVLDYNVFIQGDGLLGKITPRIQFSIAAISGILIFFLSSNTQFRISAPLFQALQVTPVNSAVVSGLAGIIENLFFVSVVLSILFFSIRYIIKQFDGGDRPLPSLLTAGFLTPFLFLLYHASVYGGQVINEAYVLFFGFLLVISFILTGSHIIGDSLHFSNNFALTFLSQTTLSTIFLSFISSSFVFFTLATISGAFAFAQQRKGNGGGAALGTIVAITFLLIAIGIFFG